MATAGNSITRANFTNRSWSISEYKFHDGASERYCYVYAPSIYFRARCAPKPNWFAPNVTMSFYLSYYNGSSWVQSTSGSLSAGNSEDVTTRRFNSNSSANGTFGEPSPAYCLWEIRTRNTGDYPARTHAWVWVGGIGVAEYAGTTQVYNTYCQGEKIRGNGALSLSPFVSSGQNRAGAIAHFNPNLVRGTTIYAAKEDCIIWPNYSFT
jgi:hypothetical protein